MLLPAELTHSQACACTRMLVLALRAEPDSSVVVDATALQQFDSSALAVLLECRREALALGKSLSVKAMPSRLRELAALYGMGELLPAAP
jgi:phospholipid transport system transporter-binding protein